MQMLESTELVSHGLCCMFASDDDSANSLKSNSLIMVLVSLGKKTKQKQKQIKKLNLSLKGKWLPAEWYEDWLFV